MRRRSAATALALGALLVASGAEGEGAGLAVTVEPVTPPGGGTVAMAVPPEPTTVTTVAAPATKGWSRAARRRPETLDGLLLSAYTAAVAAAPERCHLRLPLLEAIGQVESGNAAGHAVDDHHRVVPEIVGPALDGSRYAALPDTDGGALDHDVVWDHAVGPFQFIPSSWRVVAVDLDGDGRRDPQDVFDAAGAAMVYLCAGDRDLQDPAQLEAAVLSYNHSRAYLRLVLRWQAAFETGVAWASAPTPTLEAVAVLNPPAGAHGAHAHGGGSGVLDPVALHLEPQPPGAVTRPPDLPAAAPAVLPPAGPAAVESDDPPATSCASPTEAPGGVPTEAPTVPTDLPSDPPSDAPSDPPSDAPSDPPSDPPSDAPTGDPASGSGSTECGAEDPPVVVSTPTAGPTPGTDPVSGG
jgi:hypothetical protein